MTLNDNVLTFHITQFTEPFLKRIDASCHGCKAPATNTLSMEYFSTAAPRRDGRKLELERTVQRIMPLVTIPPLFTSIPCRLSRTLFLVACSQDVWHSQDYSVKFKEVTALEPEIVRI